MLELPALMYRDKGDQQRAGGTFSYKLVSTPEEYANAAAEGWHETLPYAIAHTSTGLAPAIEIETVEVETPEENAPATREELEIKAKELGIAFHPKIGDKNLADKISKAVATEEIVCLGLNGN